MTTILYCHRFGVLFYLTMRQYFSLMINFAMLICPAIGAKCDRGPYEAHIHNVTSCAEDQSWFYANITIYTNRGRKFIRGNFVNKREIRDPKFRFKANYLEPIKVEGLEAKNLNCHSMIARVVLRTLGVRYNAKKCTMKPTDATFKNIDIDAVLHALKDTLCYGYFHILWEIAEPGARFLCYDVYLKIVKPNGEAKIAKT